MVTVVVRADPGVLRLNKSQTHLTSEERIITHPAKKFTTALWHIFPEDMFAVTRLNPEASTISFNPDHKLIRSSGHYIQGLKT